MSDDHNPVLEIDEAWLKASGFKWHQFDRQPQKQWLLWLGDVTDDHMFGCFEDLGIEVSAHTSTWKEKERVPEYIEYWNCWLRADYSGRYSRLIHIRDFRLRYQLIGLIEAITLQPWNVANHFSGSVLTPEKAKRRRDSDERLAQRLDRKIMLERPWREIEKDETRGRAMPEHLDGAIEGGKAK